LDSQSPELAVLILFLKKQDTDPFQFLQVKKILKGTLREIIKQMGIKRE